MTRRAGLFPSGCPSSTKRLGPLAAFPLGVERLGRAKQQQAKLPGAKAKVVFQMGGEVCEFIFGQWGCVQGPASETTPMPLDADAF